MTATTLTKVGSFRFILRDGAHRSEHTMWIAYEGDAAVVVEIDHDGDVISAVPFDEFLRETPIAAELAYDGKATCWPEALVGHRVVAEL